MENLGMKNHWADRPTFVTGASGLVGGWLVRHLVELGADVVCLIRDHVPQSDFVLTGLMQKAKSVWGDVCDQALMERAINEYEIDTVFHLAAQTIVGTANRNLVSTLESNIRGTWTVLEACRRNPKVKQIVLASSDKAYGDQMQLPYTEGMPLQGKHPYDVSKSCADLIGQMFFHTYNLPVVITRCGNFFGGGDLNWNRIIPGTIRSVLKGERPVIRSDGSMIRDYFYVEDGVAAYLDLAEKLAENPRLAGEAFNFSNEIQLTVLQIVEKLLTLMNTDLKPDVRGEDLKEIRHQYLCAEKARKVLSWKPLYSLEEGLKKTIDWYSKFLAGN